MSTRKLMLWSGAALIFLLVLFAWAPDANADPIPGVPLIPGPPAPIGPSQLPSTGQGFLSRTPGLVEPGGIAVTPPALAPAAAGLFLCPGVGAAGASVGGGGGYCDFSFTPVQLSATTMGILHYHCEWGGFTPIVDAWNCWRVWPGQPDHPKLPDPDIVPDGWGVPWAINGPTPNDQWPPPGLFQAPPPGEPFPPPPPPAPQVPALPVALPPGPPGLPAAPPGPEPSATAPVPFGEPVGPPPGPFTPPAPPPPEPPPG
jgi:hypothetical protein